MRRLLRFWWVVFVISLVAAIVIPAVQPTDRYYAVQRTQQDIRQIQAVLELHRNAHGRYPTQEDGLAALVGTQLKQLPLDPWESAYVYVSNGSSRPVVYSPGVNHRDEAGLGDDIVLSGKSYHCADYKAYCLQDNDVAAYFALAVALGSLVVGATRVAIYLGRRARARLAA